MDKRYQVFISSTFADLEKERKGIMEAIIGLDCFPAGMEMFPATDTEQFEYIKTIIAQSDYYVLVIAGRYGTVAEDGISFTEKEFDYALEKNIPVLVFVKKDTDSIAADKTDQDSGLKKKLNKFRKRALDGRLGNFWDSADELKYKIYNSLYKEFKIHPRKGWIRGGEITNQEALELIEKLRFENENMKLDMKKLEESKERDEKEELNELKIKVQRMFEIEYVSFDDEKIAIDTCIKDIIFALGLELMSGVTEYAFQRLMIEKVIKPTLQDEFDVDDLELELLTSSLEEIEKRLLALELIDIKIIRDYKKIIFTSEGYQAFIESIEV